MNQIDELNEELDRREHKISSLEKAKKKLKEKYEKLKNIAYQAESILENSNEDLRNRIREGILTSNKEFEKKTPKKGHEKKST